MSLGTSCEPLSWTLVSDDKYVGFQSPLVCQVEDSNIGGGSSCDWSIIIPTYSRKIYNKSNSTSASWSHSFGLRVTLHILDKGTFSPRDSSPSVGSKLD